MDKCLNDLTGIIRKAVDDYGMIEEGDRIAVGVSGGKDSTLLLCALKHLSTYYPKKFDVEAITIDLGYEGMDFTPIRDLCNDIGVEYTIVKTDIREIVFEGRKESNPCSLCAKMRRGALNNAIEEKGMNKLALGHHFDDAVETFFMSLLYEGKISCFEPKTLLEDRKITVIRPLLYVGEQKVNNVVERLNLPVVENPCPMDKESKRYEIKSFIKDISKEYPDVKTKVFGAMQRLPINAWDKIR